MTLALLVAIALVAFSIEGAIGFGATVVMVSVGAQLVPLDVLLPMWVPLNIVLSATLLARHHRHVDWRFLFVDLAVPIAIGTAIGLALFHLPAKTLMAAILGAFVAALSILQLARPATRPLALPLRLGFLGLGGVAHGLFGTGGPMIVYVTRRRIADKARFRATLVVLWLVLNLGLVANYIALDLYSTTTITHALALGAVLVPGLVVGERLHRALDPAKFERVVWVMLLVAGLALAIRSALNA